MELPCAKVPGALHDVSASALAAELHPAPTALPLLSSESAIGTPVPSAPGAT